MQLVGDRRWDAAEAFVLQMYRVGSVDVEYRSSAVELHLHDLTLDFAMRQAEKKEGCVSWGRKLLRKYSRGRGLVAAAVEDGGLERRGLREEYVIENIYGLLIRAGRFEDLKGGTESCVGDKSVAAESGLAE